MSDKDDRRVKYTKMVLKESFIRLLGEKKISQITIKEICENADINRATFYAHYSDQYDLMQKIEDELLDNITFYLSENIQNNADIVITVEKIFESIKENAQLCKLLLSERGDINFQKRIMALVYENGIDSLITGGPMTKETAGYIHAFTVTGCVGVVQMWLDQNMTQSPRSMAELLVELNLRLSAAPSSNKKLSQ